MPAPRILASRGVPLRPMIWCIWYIRSLAPGKSKDRKGLKRALPLLGQSTLGLQVELSPAYIEVGDALTVSAFLYTEGEKVLNCLQRSLSMLTSRHGRANLVFAPNNGNALFSPLRSFDLPGAQAPDVPDAPNHRPEWHSTRRQNAGCRHAGRVPVV